MKKELSQKQGGGGGNAIEKRNIIIGVANLSEPAQKKPKPALDERAKLGYI